VRADGGLVHIRPDTPSDADALRTLHARVSDRSMYLRFFGLGRSAGEKYLTLLMQPASPSHQTLTAWTGTQLVGVAGFERSTGETAEAALLVADDRQHQGIGTLLLEYLADVARRNGIHRFEADVLGENLLALRTLRDLGCTEQVRFAAGTARVVIDLSSEEQSVTAIGVRERSAEEVSVRHILAPASVAVIGAGDRPESVGHQVMRNILVGGFTGSVYPVNPHHESVSGLPCVASARDLPRATFRSPSTSRSSRYRPIGSPEWCVTGTAP
jgi:GNAT superfamily N-acetyltransferase